MRPVSVVVVDVAADDPRDLALVHRDHVSSSSEMRQIQHTSSWHLVSVALLLGSFACVSTLEQTQSEAVPKIFEQRAQCRAGDVSACVPVHRHCFQYLGWDSCRSLAELPADMLAGHEGVFDDPLLYTSYLCFRYDNGEECGALWTHGREPSIDLGYTEAEGEAIMKARAKKQAAKAKASKRKTAKQTRESRLLEEATASGIFGGGDAGLGAFDAAFESGAAGNLALTFVYEEMCASGDPDACYTFAYRVGTAINASECGIGCGYEEVHAAMDRAHELFEQGCEKDDPVACYKMSDWRAERVYRLKADGEVPSSIEEFTNLIWGFHLACRAGLIDGCNASVRYISAFNTRAREEGEIDLWVEELVEDSGKACELAEDPSSSECEAHLFFLAYYTPEDERGESLSRRADALGLSERYGRLAWWAHPAYLSLPSE